MPLPSKEHILPPENRLESFW